MVVSKKSCTFAARNELIMNNADFWISGPLAGSWYINDIHLKNSMAAQREVQQMSLHPCSREQKLAQIARIRQHSATTKESANLERLSEMYDEIVIRSRSSRS